MNISERFWRLLRIPEFGNETRNRQARLLHIVLWSITLLNILTTPLSFSHWETEPWRPILRLVIVAVTLLAWLALRLGSLRWTGIVTVTGFWLTTQILVLQTGGLNSPWVLAQLIHTILAGLLLGGWVGITFAVLTIGADFVLYELDLANAFSFGTSNALLIDTWTAILTNFLMGGVILYWADKLVKRNLETARNNERHYMALFDNTNDAVIIVDLGHIIVRVNQQAADLLGYEISEMIGKPYSSLVAPEEVAQVRHNFDQLAREGKTPLFERVLIRKDGTRCQVEFNATVVKDEQGNLLFYQGVARDITERKRLEAKFRGLVESAPDAIVIVDSDGKIVIVNSQTEKTFGYAREALLGQPVEILIPHRYHDSHRNFRGGFVGDPHTRPMGSGWDLFGLRQDGSEFPVEITLSPLQTDEGVLISASIRNISDRKHLEEQLRIALGEMETLAMQDALTGLLNRRAITDHADAEWHRAHREKKPVCLVLVDLDNLKTINDNLGHQVGDQVITELANTIKSAHRRYDWAGRWGGDEFMLVLPGATLKDAGEVAERIRAQFMQSEQIQGLAEDVRSFVSIGVSCYSGRPGDKTNLNDLFAQADQALYVAKQAGKNRVEVYRDAETENIKKP